MALVSLGVGALLAVGLITLVSYFTGGRVTAASAPPALVGRHLPAVTEASLQGPVLSAPWSTHHPTVLVFFASWCTYCKTELPQLARYLDSHSLGAVRVLGVDTQDTRAAGHATLVKYHLNIPTFFDPSSNLASGTFLVSGLPDTVFVNSRGVVTAMTIGPITPRAFAAGVARLRA
jgi:cytochrome c biogenesis protein CcmG, thiol:disulfide interchange protein DsbE